MANYQRIENFEMKDTAEVLCDFWKFNYHTTKVDVKLVVYIRCIANTSYQKHGIKNGVILKLLFQQLKKKINNIII